jgi:DNA-binding GntR family transcriptional regulator
LAKKVYEALRNAIILGELVPGSLHSVPSLAAALQTSRTPVREALLKLADQGMVRFERNRGTRILQTTIHDLEEMFSLRLLLEVPATYRAAQQAGPNDLKALADALGAMRRVAASRSSNPKEHLAPDSRFHRTIALASGNKRLANIVETLFDLQMTRGVSTWGINREIADICNDHETIYQRIAAGDAMGAALAMRDHIALTARIIIAQETGNVAEASELELPYMDILGLLGKPAPPSRAAAGAVANAAKVVRRPRSTPAHPLARNQAPTGGKGRSK